MSATVDLAGEEDVKLNTGLETVTRAGASIPVTGQPHADAERRKKWALWGAFFLVAFVFAKKIFYDGHGSTHHVGTMQSPLGHHTTSSGSVGGSGSGARANAKGNVLGGFTPPTCPRTRIFPYHEGCPSLNHCRKRWAGVPKNEKLYGMRVSWDLGTLLGLHDATKVGAVSNLQLKKQFHVKPHFVRDYIRLEDELSDSINASLIHHHKSHDLHEVVQGELTIALGYLCCLEKHEMDLVVRILTEWVSKYRFRVPLTFDHIKCWHTTSSFTEILLMGDSASQAQLRRINIAMQRAITKGSIPVLESHEMIVPYHATLIGVQTNRNNNIAQYLPSIADSVHRVDRNIHFKVTLTGDPTIRKPFEIVHHK